MSTHSIRRQFPDPTHWAQRLPQGTARIRVVCLRAGHTESSGTRPAPTASVKDMLHAHTVEQVRAAERELMARLPEGTLMQRAAAGLAAGVVDFLGSAYGRRVLVLVGSGDNGGDALWAGAMLARRGAQVEAWPLTGRSHPEGTRALKQAGGRVVDGPSRRPEVVVDGIVGIGGRGGLREDAARAVRLLHGIPVVAVDTPSGVDVDTGEVTGDHVEAVLTVTFGTHKGCHLVDPAAQACGAVHLVDIGLELPDPALEALQPQDVAALLPRPVADSQKYARGVVGVRAGSAQYPGAALLSVAGAPAAWPGWCGTSATTTWPNASAWHTPRSSAMVGCRPGWSVPAGASVPATSWTVRCRTTSPSSSTPMHCSTWSRAGQPSSHRTPASSPRCSGRRG